MKKGTGLKDRLDFGKYKGWLVEDAIGEDPRYFRWLLKNVDRFDLDEAAEEYLEKVEA